MTQNNNIPQGYKDSLLGVIPEEWEVKKFDEILFEARLGGNYENSESNNGIPVIKMGNLERGTINLEKIQYLPEDESYNEYDILQENDLLFNTRNTLELVGKVAIWKNELPLSVYNSNLLRIKFKTEYVVSNIFMNYAFNSHYILSQLRGIATGTTSVAAIYSRDLDTINFFLPTLPEQQKIAEILSVWDEAIEKQTQLISQLETRKRGLMQQLLTGKKRMKGFSGKWKEVKLGYIATFFSGGTPNTNISEYYVGGIPFIKSGEIHKSHTEQFISQEALSKSSAKLVEKEDILYALYGATSGECAISQINGAINQAVLCIRTMENRKFILSVLQSNKQHYIDCYLQGGQGNLSAEIVKSYSLKLPSLAEQTAIANILSTADTEITLAKQKLARLKEQKKGLMQVLLTGKKRVKI